jgi:hypothetical protein
MPKKKAPKAIPVTSLDAAPEIAPLKSRVKTHKVFQQQLPRMREIYAKMLADPKTTTAQLADYEAKLQRVVRAKKINRRAGATEYKRVETKIHPSHNPSRGGAKTKTASSSH